MEIISVLSLTIKQGKSPLCGEGQLCHHWWEVGRLAVPARRLLAREQHSICSCGFNIGSWFEVAATSPRSVEPQVCYLQEASQGTGKGPLIVQVSWAVD